MEDIDKQLGHAWLVRGTSRVWFAIRASTDLSQHSANRFARVNDLCRLFRGLHANAVVHFVTDEDGARRLATELPDKPPEPVLVHIALFDLPWSAGFNQLAYNKGITLIVSANYAPTYQILHRFDHVQIQ